MHTLMPKNNLQKLIDLTVMFLDRTLGGLCWSTLREPFMYKEKANFMQKDARAGFEPRSSSLQSNFANHYF